MSFALLTVWVAAAAYDLGVAAVEARGAKQDLESLREQLSPEELLSSEGQAGLRAAGIRFGRAERRASSLVLAPVRSFPIVGRQLRAIEVLAGAGGEVVDVAADAAMDIEALSDAVADRGRVATVEALGAAVAAADARLAAISLGPGDALVGPLHDARASLATELAEARKGAADARVVTTGLTQLLEGSRYLILASNNAEMQAGWGMPLSIGVLEVDDGELELGGMEPAAGVVLPEGAVAPVGDLERNWGFVHPTQDFRLLAFTPHFPEAAPLAAEMWETLRGQPVDGVLALDPLALRAILHVTGPVEAGGRRVSEDDVVALSLHDGYVEQAATGRDQRERRERQSEIAVAAVQAISRPDTDIIALTRSLADVASRRHVLAWSSRPAEQRAWETAGIDGALEPRSLLVSTMNQGANKLDWFMDVEADISTQEAAAGVDVAVEITVENSTPKGEPQYVAGPEGTFGAQAPGDWAGYISVHLPGAATDGRFDGVEGLVAAGASGRNRVIAARLDVPRGTSRTYTARFTLPAGTMMIVEPSARVRPIRWTHGGDQWKDGDRRTIPMGG